MGLIRWLSGATGKGPDIPVSLANPLPVQVAAAVDATPVVPSDATVLTNVSGLYVGGAGNVVVTTAGGLRTFLAVAAGTTLNLTVTKVMAATTATGIIALKRA